MRTLKLTLQYDGTHYVGWQRQANGISVQQRLEEVLQEIEGGPVSVAGAGRTDAGVHAVGQVASVRLAHAIDVAPLQRAVNARLPDDIRVTGVEQAPADFHARFSARAKTYRYCILNSPLASPFERHYAWHVSQPLGCGAMAAAARALEGRHDFAAFRAAGSDVGTTERTLHRVQVLRVDRPGGSLPTARQEHADDSPSAAPVRAADVPGAAGALVICELTGDGFLRHMARNIVGTLVEVGSGRREPASMKDLLASRDRRLAGPTAPAHGLFLVSVVY
jgi:tRNA pseudouridine38-40 synthase